MNSMLLYCILLTVLHITRKVIPSFSFLYFAEIFLLVILLSECGYRVIKKIHISSLKSRYPILNYYVWFVAALFLGLFGLMLHAMYTSFTFEWFDFGMIHQAICNTSKGRLLEITNASIMTNHNWPNVSMLSGHVEWILLLFSPLYLISGNPELLLIIKIIFLTTSIFIIDILAKEFVTDNERFLVTIIYAMYTPLHFIALKDFNADPFVIPFILGAYLTYVKNKKKTFWLYILLTLACKEYAAIAVIAMGILILLRYKDWKYSLTCIFGGIIYFCICYFIINPWFNPDKGTTMLSMHFSQIGGDRGFSGIAAFIRSDPLQIIRMLASNGNNLFYMLMPLFFLPLFDISTLCALLLLLPKDLLTSMDISNHRLSITLPFLFIGFIHFLKKCTSEKRKKMLIYCFIASCISAFFYGPTPFGHRFWRETYKYIPDHKDRIARKMIDRVPDDVPISVTPSFTPYLGNRKIMYILPETGYFSKRTENIAEFILIDTADESYSWRTGNHPAFDSLFKLIIRQGYKLTEHQSGIYLFSNSKCSYSSGIK